MSLTQLPMSPFFLRVVTSVHNKNNGKRAKVVGTELKILPYSPHPENTEHPALALLTVIPY